MEHAMREAALAARRVRRDDDDAVNLARRIADAASDLDWLKNAGTPEQRADAARHIDILHDIAEGLAGSRVAEIYGPLKVTA